MDEDYQANTGGGRIWSRSTGLSKGRIIGNKLPLPFACSGKSKLFRTFWQDYRAKALLHSERDTCKHEFPFSTLRTCD